MIVFEKCYLIFGMGQIDKDMWSELNVQFDLYKLIFDLLKFGLFNLGIFSKFESDEQKLLFKSDLVFFNERYGNNYFLDLYNRDFYLRGFFY